MQANLKPAAWSIGCVAAFGLYAVTGTTPAQAQMSSTNCMAMSGGMMHCDTMQMGGANNANDGWSAFADAIVRGRENSLRKKIGQMLINGDCEGAARFAMEKGKIEMGTDIAQSCKRRPMASAYASKNPNTPSAARPSPIPPNELENALRNAAAAIKTPVAIDDITTISKVEVIGSQILLTADVSRQGVTFTDENRVAVVNQLCAFNGAQPLMQAGASVRIVYNGTDRKQIGAVVATRQECGF